MPARPAYPTIPPVDNQNHPLVTYPAPNGGMTLREYYVGHAIIAVALSTPSPLEGTSLPAADLRAAAKRRAQFAVLLANEMVRALSDYPEP